MSLLNADGTWNYGGTETFTPAKEQEEMSARFRAIGTKIGEALAVEREEVIRRCLTDADARKPFRAGDGVYHAPSGEKWLLAADERDGEVVCAGWPESIAKAPDCILIRRASDEARLYTLKSVAESCGDQMRGSWARRDLLK